MEYKKNLLDKIKEKLGLKSKDNTIYVEPIHAEQKTSKSFAYTAVDLAAPIDSLNYELENLGYVTNSNSVKAVEIVDKIKKSIQLLYQSNADLKSAYTDYYKNEKEVPSVVSKILNNQIGYKVVSDAPKFCTKYNLEDIFLDLSRFGEQEESYSQKESNSKYDELIRLYRTKESIEFEEIRIYEMMTGHRVELSPEDRKKMETPIPIRERVLQSVGLLSPKLGIEEMREGLLYECYNRGKLNEALNSCVRKNIDPREIFESINMQKQQEENISANNNSNEEMEM